MEDHNQEARTGLLDRLVGRFVRHDDDYEEEPIEAAAPTRNLTATATFTPASRYTICLRKEIQSFDDVIAAAHGLKRGEAQILNLSACEPATRQKIVDWMSGVNFAENGTWEAVGEDIYLICPVGTYVEVTPDNVRAAAGRA